jgi:two-component system phosphate regulon sensor histidine kinase PhoR
MHDFQDDYMMDIIQHSTMWETVLQGENWRGHLQFQTPSRDNLDVDMVVVPVSRDTGRVFIAVLRDISEQRKLDNMKAQFIADAAHDLGNPLAIMTLKMYLLKQQPQYLDRHLPVLEQQLARLNALVDDLLIVSRLDRRVLKFIPYPTQLNDIVRSVLAGQLTLAEKKQIDLQVELSHNLPLILGDDSQLQRVFVNLLANAINYTPENGQIRVQTQVDGRQVILTIKDTGIGISPDEIERIFDRFFRGSHASGTADGTGLGLSIVYEILSLHDASIEVDSQLNEGSEFRLYFNIDKPSTG